TTNSSGYDSSILAASRGSWSTSFVNSVLTSGSISRIAPDSLSFMAGVWQADTALATLTVKAAAIFRRTPLGNWRSPFDLNLCVFLSSQGLAFRLRVGFRHFEARTATGAISIRLS